MKKREFNNLKLRKRVISNLQEQRIHGGADAITSTTYIIVRTVKILTKNFTKPEICRTGDTDCTLTTVTTSTPVPATTG